MFTMPQPEDAEKWEGCPVVQLSDTKQDLVRFLSALFDLGSTYFGSNHRLPFIDVSAFLRLGTKYGVDYLRQEAIKRLESVFPPQLQAFRNAYTDVALALKVHAGSETDKFPNPGLKVADQDMFAIINLASTFGLSAILPLVYYCCAQHDDDALVDGSVDEDGVHHQLSCVDLRRVLRGRASLQDLRDRSLCSTKLGSLRDRRLKVMRFAKCLMEVEAVVSSTSLCSSCKQAYGETAGIVRGEAWNRLGDIFALEVEWPLS
ncbi:hypothetical protein EIP91_009996 [Steccherinum ochraceum]|uniref:Uncharacterized protein n=1 Tax=Steccherinum ochraceum TaxID=92696 RepID=A0A4R0RND5_9APHY|nr:hypothetical protein EIP91_009996 [Steccherinum ochraceum]